VTRTRMLRGEPGAVRTWVIDAPTYQAIDPPSMSSPCLVTRDAGRQNKPAGRADRSGLSGSGSWPRRDAGPRRLERAQCTSRVNCPMGGVGGTIDELGRRIGQRWSRDATRAPTPVPRPGRAARCRRWASRDWPKNDKYVDNYRNQFLERFPPGLRTLHINPRRQPGECRGTRASTSS
jgi:hypothetical protein